MKNKILNKLSKRPCRQLAELYFGLKGAVKATSCVKKFQTFNLFKNEKKRKISRWLKPIKSVKPFCRLTHTGVLAGIKTNISRRGYARTAERIAGGCVGVVGLVARYPPLRGVLLRRYPKLFGALLHELTPALCRILTIHSGVEGGEKRGGSMWYAPATLVNLKPNAMPSPVPFGLSVVRSRVPRTFNFFFKKLKERYGYRTPEIYIRLDVPVPKTKRFSRSTVDRYPEVSLYLLRRRIRRWYGYLTPHRLWRVRQRARVRIGGFNSKPFVAFFEFRLDVFLVRLHLAKTLYDARAMLLTGVVMVNHQIRTNYSYVVGAGDIINIAPKWLNLCQVRQIYELYNSLVQPSTYLYRIFPGYIEASYRSLAFCYIKNKYSPNRLPYLNSFKVQYALNCGRFIF